MFIVIHDFVGEILVTSVIAVIPAHVFCASGSPVSDAPAGAASACAARTSATHSPAESTVVTDQTTTALAAKWQAQVARQLARRPRAVSSLAPQPWQIPCATMWGVAVPEQGAPLHRRGTPVALRR